MNRFQYDNINPEPTPNHRKMVLEQKVGIGHRRRTKKKQLLVKKNNTSTNTK